MMISIIVALNKKSLTFINDLVGVRGLEPRTSASQTRRASHLRYTPSGGEYNTKHGCPSS